MPRIGATLTQSGTYAPLVIVEYKYAKAKFSGPACVDSGADSTLIPWEVAIALGADPIKWPSSPSGGASGKFNVHYGNIDVIWRGVLITKQVAVAPANALEHSLLGRADFFTMYVVRFNWHRNPPDFFVDPVTASKKSK